MYAFNSSKLKNNTPLYSYTITNISERDLVVDITKENFNSLI